MAESRTSGAMEITADSAKVQIWIQGIFSEFIKAKAAQCIGTERLSNSQTLSLSSLVGRLECRVIIKASQDFDQGHILCRWENYWVGISTISPEIYHDN